MDGLLKEFDLYLSCIEPVALDTRLAYVRDVGYYAKYLDQMGKKLADTNGDLLSGYHKYLHDKQISARTRTRAIHALRKFFIFMHTQKQYPKWHLLLRTPLYEKSLPVVLTRKEVQDLLQATSKGYGTHKKRDRLIIMLLYGCGMRMSELLHIRVMDVCLSQDMVRVQGKGDKQRYIPLPLEVKQALEEYIKNKQLQHEDYLFTCVYKHTRGIMRRQTVAALLQKYWKMTGHTKRIYPHLLRHTYASHLINNGMHVREIQSLLGHQHLSSTQVYTHVTVDNIKKQYQQLHSRA